MPIVGLTDNIAPTFPEIGKVRKGAKRSGKGPGKDLKYFRFTSDRPEVEAAFYTVYPQRPTRINVVLPHDTAEENFTAWQEEWGASITLKHRCDGVHVVRRWNDATGEYEDFPEGEGPPCPYTIPPEKGGKFRTEEVPGCQIAGRLTVVIPALVAAGYVGYVTVLTGAKHDVLSILRTLAKMEGERRKSGQTLAWLPFTLERVEEEISSPAWKNEPVGKRHKVTKSLLKLTPAEEWVRAQVEHARRDYLALPEPAEVAEAEDVLAQGRALLHGGVENGDWDEIVEENGNGDPPAPEPETVASGDNGNPPAPEPETDPLKAAMEYKLDSGRILGQLPDTEIREMLDKINAMTNPKRKMRTIKAHIEVLLAYLASVTQAEGNAEEAPAIEVEEGNADNDDNWAPRIVQALINAKLTENTHSALGMLKRLDLTPTDAEELIVECATKYRESRDAGGEVGDAAAIANTWLAGRQLTGAMEIPEETPGEQEELPL